MTLARLGALALTPALAVLPALGAGGSAAEGPPPTDRAVLAVIRGASFEEAMAIPEVAALARAGGAGLLVDAEEVTETIEGLGRRTPDVERIELDRTSPALGAELLAAVGSSRDERVLVIVLSDSAPVDGGNDELAPVVMAAGTPAKLFPADGPQGSLTSDSTRRDGVVAGVDVGATLRASLGLDGSTVGERIRVIEGPPPYELHGRYVAQRRMYVPIGAAGALYLAGAGLFAVGALVARRTIPERWRRVAGWGALSVAMLPIGMLAAGYLPELSYATAVPMIAIVTVFGTMAFSPLERGEVTMVPAGVGVAVLAFFAVAALTGWSGMLTPLLGGSQLDGGRFYGFPNVAIGLSVGAALWVAHRLPTWTGFWLLCGLGLFIGLPYVGANLGGAVTAFVGAGLWMAIRERERLGAWLGAGVVAAVAALGGGVILIAHAVAPLETHISAFEENVSGIGGVVQKFVDRLEVGTDLIARSPAALVPVIGLPVLLFVVLRPPAPIRGTFERWPAWRDALLVTVLAGLVAYVVNDSGPAAAGLAFGLGLGGMLGVSLLVAPGKMGER